MSGSPWREIKDVDRSSLREARLQAHYAVQWLARAARAYVTPAPDDHHTNLGWNDAIARPDHPSRCRRAPWSDCRSPT